MSNKKINSIMIYVLLDKKLCEDKRIFLNNERLPEPDGRVIITLNDVNFVRFSLGKQELINHTDLNDLKARLSVSAASEENE